jgi:hypothetical protein
VKQYRYLITALILTTMTSAIPLGASQRLVREIVDSETGAVVRSYKTTTGAAVELSTPSLVVRKETSGQVVVTTLSGGGERLTIEAGRHGVVVAGRGGRVEVARGDKAAAERARRLVRGSDLVTRVNALIARMPLTVNTPGHSVLVTTRALLLALSGQESAAEAQVRDWARKVAQARPAVVVAPPIVKASLTSGAQSRTPTECWESYSREAIDAWIEYEQCLDDVRWWDVGGMAACLVIYEMRAIGAFAWWTTCVTLRS